MEKLFETEHTLTMFFVFFLPGFISLKVYDLRVPSEPRDFSKSFFEVVAYSALNFIAMFWLIALMRSGQMPSWLWYICLLIVGIIMPVFWPRAITWLRDRPEFIKRTGTRGPISRVWDCLFIRREQYWVIAHLKDGRRIGGLYSTRSIASSSPAGPEIYLEEVWRLDENGSFQEQIDRTAGVLVFGEEMLALEFFRYR